MEHLKSIAIGMLLVGMTAIAIALEAVLRTDESLDANSAVGASLVISSLPIIVAKWRQRMSIFRLASVLAIGGLCLLFGNINLNGTQHVFSLALSLTLFAAGVVMLIYDQVAGE